MKLEITTYWCCSRNKSFTVFTGLKVIAGTSTKTVFQLLIAQFQRPGSSNAFSSFPFFDLLVMKPVAGSTNFGKSNDFPA